MTYNDLKTEQVLIRDGLIRDSYNGAGSSLSSKKFKIFNACPSGVYAEIIDYFLYNDTQRLEPPESESRVLFSSIHFSDDISKLIEEPGNTTGVSIGEDGSITVWSKEGKIAPAILYSSTCFSLFISFFLYLKKKRRSKALTRYDYSCLKKVKNLLSSKHLLNKIHESNIPAAEDAIFNYMAGAGKDLYSLGLVNSFFGNISFRKDNKMFISRTGAYLNDLAGKILKCDLEGEECKNASSEYPSHREIYKISDFNTIIHGHPKFTVIVSLDCEEECSEGDSCLYYCRKERRFMDIPIISGETGKGEFGLDKTLPPAVREFGSAVVCGHGVFIAGKDGYEKLIKKMFFIEESAKKRVFKDLE